MGQPVHFLDLGIGNFLNLELDDFQDLRVQCVLFNEVEDRLLGHRFIRINDLSRNSIN